MNVIDNNKLKKFQEFIKYKFREEDLLTQALTTPQLANLTGQPSYEFLETLGDAVIKVIFILKLYFMNIKDSGEITKIKADLESDKTLKKVAKKIRLDEFIFKTENQRIKGTRILADVFEALCGALFLDSHYNLELVEEKLFEPFYEDLDLIIQNSIISSKNELLEFLQFKFKTSINVQVEWERKGEDHDPIWIAKNPKILDKEQRELLKIPQKLKSGKFKTKKDAEKSLFNIILNYLKGKEL
ncbi:MAG: ribonuclease III domain-containing protein [Candidatus Hodarchaeota archaeon]